MVLAFYIFVDVSITFFLMKFLKKNLHVLEIAVYWFGITILVQNYSAPFVMNLKFLVIPDVLSLKLAHLINRTVLYPFLCIIFLNRYIILKTKGTKLVFIISYAVLLSGAERLEERLGVCLHVHWKAWWTLSCWIIILLIAIGFMKFFRKQLQKGLQTNELFDELE